MTNEEKKISHNDLLNELIKERPTITHFTELGITLQDYITAEVLMLENESDPFNSTLYTNYAMCLFFTVAERMTKITQFLH
jgi:PIN domain nuclease of toxin-antitoxin system